MNQKTINSLKEHTLMKEENVYFYTETIEVSRISSLAFLKAGEKNYTKNHFYWQNANQTLTMVGLGHAKILTSEKEKERYDDIAKQWSELCTVLKKGENDLSPHLFGGFSFDPTNKIASEWVNFPSAYFVLPSIQLITKNGQSSVIINLISSESDKEEALKSLRVTRDQLIYKAQLNEFEQTEKPVVKKLSEIQKENYKNAVENTTAKIQQGEAEKVVIARSVNLEFEHKVQSVTALHHIANEQQESYHFGLQKDGELFFGATPERLIEISNGRVYSACVAGSIKRGKTAEEDDAVGLELLNDPKNREEHQYVVDMISNVFEELCTDIVIPDEPKLMKIRDIQHLFTPVDAIVKEGKSIFHFVEALHPTPALGGVPTEQSMAIIREEEQMDRGYYAGPIGWLDMDGNGEFAVAIRSALLTGDEAYLYAGGGIVADSEVEKEYDETWIKFRPVLRALGGQLNDK